jgi:hypothetical protein
LEKDLGAKQELKKDAPGKAECDEVRLIIAAVLWLAREDVAVAVELVTSWLVIPDSQPDSLVPSLGRACAWALLQVYVGASLTEPADETHLAADKLGPFVGLGKFLAAADHLSSVYVLLELARRSAGDPAWAPRLGPARWNQSTDLLDVLHRLPVVRRHWVEEILNDWSRPRKELGEEAVPAAVVRLEGWLRGHLRPEPRRGLPALDKDGRYGVLILDTALSKEGRRRLDELGRKLLNKLERDGRKPSWLQLVVYRAGQISPVILPGEEPKPGELLPDDLRVLPPLVGPILDQHDPRCTQFVILLTMRSFIDKADWESDWIGRGYVCCLEPNQGPPNWVSPLAFLPFEPADPEGELASHVSRQWGRGKP